ncbi:hypothetical protein JOS77_27070 [Chromobacterium haemolyticum]|nr:hypothetical protein JOS77_27070 [Chromobacterium haemolyticum]
MAAQFLTGASALVFSLLHALVQRFPATRRTLAVFPSQPEALSYARQKLAEGRARLSIAPAAAGWAVRQIGGAA